MQTLIRREIGRAFGRREIVNSWDRAIAAYPDCPQKPKDYNFCRLSHTDPFVRWFKTLPDAEQGRLAFPDDAQQPEPEAIAEPALSVEQRLAAVEAILRRQGYQL